MKNAAKISLTIPGYFSPRAFFALLCLLTVAVACKKKEETPTPALNTSCQITREEDEDGYTLFEYNADGRITKSATYTKNKTLETTLWTDYVGSKVEKIRVFYKGKTSGNPDLTATATTDATGNILTLTAPFLGGTPSTATFTYAGNRLSTLTRNTTTFRYEYDGNGNVIRTFYKIGSQAEELLSENTYDTKVNPNRAGSYVALLVFAAVFGDISDIYSPNNTLSQKNYDGKTVSSTSSFVYTYNDKGFPLTVKQTLKQTGKADEVSNTTLQYICQ